MREVIKRTMDDEKMMAAVPPFRKTWREKENETRVMCGTVLELGMS